mgnify:CR=1 FL=1
MTQSADALRDTPLEDEITLVGDLVVAATSHDGSLSQDEIDDALVAHVKSEYSLLLGERSAEDLKIGAGSAFPLREELSAVADRQPLGKEEMPAYWRLLGWSLREPAAGRRFG